MADPTSGAGRAPAGVTGRTRVAGVIGTPVRHSLSPAIHNAAFAALDLDWVFVAFDVPDGASGMALAGMRALGVAGLSVTMPHKAAVIEGLDELSADAEALGAVNCVHRGGRGLIGDNTDGAGFLDALRADDGFEPEGRRCVVVGAGGAGRAVARALGAAGAADVAVVNRSEEPARRAAALAGPAGRVGAARDVPDADLVVNATPLGMGVVIGPDGAGEPLPVDPELLGAGQLVVDLVYHPATTPFVRAARERGATATNGLGMLIHQAAHAFRHWTGEDPPLEVMSAAALMKL